MNYSFNRDLYCVQYSNLMYQLLILPFIQSPAYSRKVILLHSVFQESICAMKLLTVEQAVALISEDSDDDILPTISILPNDERGDVESETEDICEEVLQPTSETENATGIFEVIQASEDDELVLPPSAKRQRIWKKSDHSSDFPTIDVADPLDVLTAHDAALSPYALFRRYADDNFIHHLVNETNRYAHEIKNDISFSTTSLEMEQFLGILLYSGYVRLPQERDYWSTSEDFSLPFVASSMVRNRFQLLKKYLHLSNNSDLGPSKCAKVVPIYDLMNKNLRQFGVFSQNLSIDESMVPYYGHHSTKQFIRGKPIRFGYKLWALCSSDGYPYHLEIYTGKSEERVAPLGESVVMKLANLVENPNEKELYFDNFFTSYSTLDRLAELGMRATGTIRSNRTNKCPLSKDALSKKERGSFDYSSDGKIMVCSWKDSATVMLATNFDTVFPIRYCQRYSVKERRRITVTQPKLVDSYNKKMGGVDVFDKLLGSYRPTIRGKKWWYNLFINSINTLCVASWKMYNYLHPDSPISHIEFVRQVTVSLLKSQKVPRSRLGGPTARVVTEVQKDQTGHFLVSASQGRCALCKSNTRKMCEKCRKRLHINCFLTYHT